jgi:hypothetical protein
VTVFFLRQFSLVLFLAGIATLRNSCSSNTELLEAKLFLAMDQV